MFRRTLPHLRCPSLPARPAKAKASARVSTFCGGPLGLGVIAASRGPAGAPAEDILQGELVCSVCHAAYPILGGVAIVVSDVLGYLHTHVKGLARVVSFEGNELPKAYARELRAAYAEATQDEAHIEEDLESERVTALYALNHYVSARGAEWWHAGAAGLGADSLIGSLIREHWDRGPLARIAELGQGFADGSRVLEPGCGVGSLARRLGPTTAIYLGVDSSLASIALARHLALGAPYRGQVRFPGDLLEGPLTRAHLADVGAAVPLVDGTRDFVVGEIDELPVARDAWDVCIALNAIDMLEEPARMPEAQAETLVAGGLAIQSCPYIWHERVARKLRARINHEPRATRAPIESAAVARWLYERAGFEIELEADHVPWLFFKHLRQLEIYSVHLFQARKRPRPA